MEQDITPQELMARAEMLYSVFRDAGFTEQTFRELGTAGFFGTPFVRLSNPLKIVLLKIVRDYEAQTANRRILYHTAEETRGVFVEQVESALRTQEGPIWHYLENTAVAIANRVKEIRNRNPTQVLLQTIAETRQAIAQAIPETGEAQAVPQTPHPEVADTQTADAPNAATDRDETQSGETTQTFTNRHGSEVETKAVETVEAEYIPPQADKEADKEAE